MDEHPGVPAFNVDRVMLAGLIPLARYYHCIYCGHDLTDWVMKQSPVEPSTCPICAVRIGEKDIAQAQRDTKLGCLYTLVGIACFFLAAAVIVTVLWLTAVPQR